MSDDARNADSGEEPGPRAGERLAEARRLRQITLPQIARELHLDEVKVQALEENRFDVLGAPVFAKGHLRKYAEVVGVSIDDVMADYYALNRATGAPPVVGPPRERPPAAGISPKILLLPLGLALLAAGWWVYDTVIPGEASLEPGMPAVRQPAARPVTSPATPPAERAPDRQNPAAGTADDAPPPSAAPAAADEAPGLAAAPAPAQNAAPAVDAGIVTLGLTFSGDCWTEVTDADGERLFFDLGRDGRSVSLSGPAPLRVLLGNSNHVSVTVNGAPYVIAAADLRGETARLTINP